MTYVKGMLLLRALKQMTGRDRFDTFMQCYFDQFAFQSVTTAEFVSCLDEYPFRSSPEFEKKIAVGDWI